MLEDAFLKVVDSMLAEVTARFVDHQPALAVTEAVQSPLDCLA